MNASQNRQIASRLPVKVENRLRSLIDQGHGPAAIYEELIEEFGHGAISKATVDRRYKALKALDNAAEWFMDRDANPEEAGLILGTLAVVMERTDGRVRFLTKTEAEWVAAIRAAYPDLGAWDAYRLAKHYITRNALGESTSDLDSFLAFAPWHDDGERFNQAIRAGWITPPPFIGSLSELAEWFREKSIRGVDVYNVKGTDHE